MPICHVIHQRELRTKESKFVALKENLLIIIHVMIKQRIKIGTIMKSITLFTF